MGNIWHCGPRSRAFLAYVAELFGNRRIAGVFIAASASRMPPEPCSMSRTTKSSRS